MHNLYLSETGKMVSPWADLSFEFSNDTRIVTRGDTTYTMDTANIGRREYEPLAIQEFEEMERAFEVIDSGDEELIHEMNTTEDVDGVHKKLTHVNHNTGEIEWFTPKEYIDAAIEVMGGIDLDPAFTPEANKVVRASIFYTAEDNGLEQVWNGRVWMNPPYSGNVIGQFCHELIGWYENGNVTEAIVLVNNATETQWFQMLAKNANSILFPSSRIKFWHPGRPSISPLQGQAIIYFGTQSDRFTQVFRKFGFVCDIC